MSYLTDSYIIFTLKMESVSQIKNFVLKMMVKSGLEKIFFDYLHAGHNILLLRKSAQNHKFINKDDGLPAWRTITNIFFSLCRRPNRPVRAHIFSRPVFTIIFRPTIVFLDTDSVLRVKTMYKSVK